jgi:hypothetical protein
MAGARDRKRAERQKRKRRSTERVPSTVETTEAALESNGDGAPAETFQEKMSRRYEERNAEARAKLEPLEEGERPTAVTVGAIVSAVLAIVFTVSAVLAIAGVEAGGREIKPLPIIVFGLVVVNSVLQAIGTTLLLAGSGTLFYFMIRAMARIQMPSPPGDV